MRDTSIDYNIRIILQFTIRSNMIIYALDYMRLKVISLKYSIMKQLNKSDFIKKKIKLFKEFNVVT